MKKQDLDVAKVMYSERPYYICGCVFKRARQLNSECHNSIGFLAQHCFHNPASAMARLFSQLPTLLEDEQIAELMNKLKHNDQMWFPQGTHLSDQDAIDFGTGNILGK